MILPILNLIDFAITVLIIVLMIAFAITAFRLVFGPGYADRFVALDMLTGIAVAATALTAVVTGRNEFLDVGLGLALIGFVGTVALAAFLEKKRGLNQ